MPYSSKAKYMHERLINPKECDPKSFRVKKISDKVKVTVCCPKGEYNVSKQRCNVGMIAQKKMIRK